MRVLVTGGAGFIGSHVVEHLLADGHTVRVFDALVEQVHHAGGPRYVPAEAEFIHGDMRDRDRLAAAVSGVEQIVHLAAEVGVGQSMYEVSRYLDANTSGTGVLLDILANDQHQVAKIVVASSMSIYGEGEYECSEHGRLAPRLRPLQQLDRHHWEPQCADCGRDLAPVATSETKALYPSSVYAISKMDQELLCLAVGSAYDIGVTAVRYFNAYGPRQALSNPYTGVAAIFSARLLSGQRPIVTEDGRQLRDFIHVQDVARATVAALSTSKADGRAINVGTGQPISINQVATLLATELGREDLVADVTGTYRAGDIRHCWADPTLARDLLGFEATYRFADLGVRELIAWVSAQPIVAQPDPMRELTRRGLAR